MDNKADQPSPASLWLAYLAKGGTMKELRNMDQSQLDAMYKVAFAQFNSGHFTEALKVFRHLCLLDHTRYSYFLGLGLSQYELSLFAQAAATLAHAEKLDQKDPRASLMMAKCFVEIKRWSLAQKALSETVTRASQSDRWKDELQQAEKLISFVQGKLQ
ncbi:SycD/LcrH family type III secretion system chaperone [Endozoicomonas atrinae]|uniref:SycD/LcrH family type III secretion system chaperone n=1 Tax=Endozoicomonas atrinae TaxID=1333660 RepID=UPI003AFF7F24